MTVWENLAVAVPGQQGESFGKLLLMPRRVRNREAEVRVLVDRVLARLELSHVATSRAGTLSGGQKKLLELGRLLLANPKLILLDEPFAGVNPVMIERISELIVQLHKEGHGFLIVEHNIPALAKLTNYLHVMDRGRLIASGRPRTVLKDPKVRAAYIGGDA
jgi:branched-chain amino acid transport system ATP-binding protein